MYQIPTSPSPTKFYYNEICSKLRGVWNYSFEVMAETIHYPEPPLSTIFFSQNEPHAHHQQD